MKKKILVLGYFGIRNNELDGQTIKTRSIYELLISKDEHNLSIEKFDTQKFQYSKISFFKMLYKLLRCNTLVYIPAHKNLKYLFPLIYYVCKLKSSQILYFVVGGWLEEYLENKKLHISLLSKIDAILTESNDLNQSLIVKYHFKNVRTFPNFRIHSFMPRFIENNDSFNIVFMARINRMKGIDYVFYLANYLKKNSDKRINIDFYGPFEFKKDEDYFFNELEKYKNCTYKGVLDPEKIYTTLNNYDLMVFPTRYFTEGFPGSVLDAYISGIPVITTHWKHATDFIQDRITGIIVPFENSEDEFLKAVLSLYEDRNLLFEMKHNAFEHSKAYSSDLAWGILTEYLHN